MVSIHQYQPILFGYNLNPSLRTKLDDDMFCECFVDGRPMQVIDVFFS